MDSSQEKAEMQNSSLRLLQAYDSSDSCDEMDDANHNNIPQMEVCRNNTNNTSVLSDSKKLQSVESEILSTTESNQSLSVDSEMDIIGSNDSVIVNELVLKNNLKNLSEHGPVDGDAPEKQAAEGTDNAIVENKENDVIDYEMMPPRENNRWSEDESSSEDSSQESESDSSSEWESLKGAEATSDSDEANSNTKPTAVIKKKVTPKVKGEMDLEDLPPIEDLTITVPTKECIQIGTIYDIVDRLVIVEALPNKPTLDLDTVLFLDEGSRTLGHIYDVFGQVTQPFYCVRFNSKDHINDKGIDCGMCVYCAPKTEHTHLVFVSDLMRIKGSDASWKDDVEPPAQFLEFSDDEEERRVKHALKEQKKKANATAAEGGETSEGVANKRLKPTPYEERMNKKNLQKTAEFNRRNQPTQSPGYGRGRGQYNPFGLRYETAGQPTPSEIQWSPNNSFYVGGNPFDFTQQRFRMGGQFEPPRVPQRVPRSPFPLNRPRFTSFPPPGLWFVNRAQGSPWPPPPPPGFPGT